MADRHAPFRAADFLAPTYWPTWFGIFMVWLLSRLPFTWQLQFGAGLGTVLYHLIPERRRICLKNLSFAFPELSDSERGNLCRKVYKHIGYTVAEMASLWFQPMSRLEKRYTLVGSVHLDKALNSGKGIILLQAHFNTLEFCGAWLATQIPGCAAVYDDPKNKLYASFLRNRRQRYIDITIDNRDIRSMIKQLKTGGLVWYSPDQSVSRKDGGIETTFFSRQVLTTPGTSRMASMTDALVLPYLPARSSTKGQYTLTIFPPIEGVPSGDKVQDTESINRIFEAHIRQHPEQYFWVHKRFKRVSKDLPDPYQ